MEPEAEERMVEVLRLRADPRVAAFAALERVLSPERWDDPAELVRATFLAGWHAGAHWHGGISGDPGRRRPVRRSWSVRSDWWPGRPVG